MRKALQRINSTTLVLYAAAVDAALWLGVFPFEFYCRSLVAQPHVPAWKLLAVLCLNLLFLALIASAALATGELIRRGFTRRAPVLVRSLRETRSRRFVR